LTASLMLRGGAVR